MKIQDLAGLSKPLTRLIEVVSKGAGAVSTPYLIRKTADARAYEIKVIADALKDVREKNQLPVIYDGGAIEVWQKPDDKTLILDSQPIDQRVAGRLEYQERKRQDNIENVTAAAAAELSKETVIPDKHPDDDWIARFFSSAQDVSSQEMQELWGKILAGEIKNPGSYSLRTLDFVRNITKAEAQVFEKVGRLALSLNKDMAFILTHDKEWLSKERGIRDGDHFLLGELGIMYPTDLAILVDYATKPEQALFGDDHLLLIKRGDVRVVINYPVWKFTGIGLELLPLIQKPFDEQYFENIGKYLLSQKLEPAICKITQRQPDGLVSYQVIKKIEAEKQKNEAPPPSATA
jgi:hypothetical protein